MESGSTKVTAMKISFGDGITGMFSGICEIFYLQSFAKGVHNWLTNRYSYQSKIRVISVLKSCLTSHS